MTGVELIAAERQRQITEEGWTPEHDDGHDSGELAMAAACYAAPEKIFTIDERANAVIYQDPFPWRWDRRFHFGSCRENPGNVLPDPDTYSKAERIDLLTKAGALIAAELDRLQREK